MAKPIGARVFVVDDHPMFRDSMRELLDRTPGLKSCGEANSFDEALRALPPARPDLVVLDLGLPGRSGFELLKHLRDHHPSIRVLVLSMHEEERYALRALRDGAVGYVMKSARADEIREAVLKAAQGRIIVSEEIQQVLLASTAEGVEPRQRPDQMLSKRELDVFECLGKGMTVKECAACLHLRETTINSYCERLKAKLDVTRLRDVARLAYDWLRDNEL